MHALEHIYGAALLFILGVALLVAALFKFGQEVCIGLTEALAGVIWRKRRLRMAEAAVYREKLRHDAKHYNDPEHLVGAALLPITGNVQSKADIPRALSATPTDTARDLRDVKRDQAMTQRAWNILTAGGPDAYTRALSALRDGHSVLLAGMPGRAAR
jgi:hypothetical protein